MSIKIHIQYFTRESVLNLIFSLAHGIWYLLHMRECMPLIKTDVSSGLNNLAQF